MLSVEYKATGELIPYVNNSRTHSEAQIQQVAASIKEFGFTNPILIDDEGGIIAGHGRLAAAQLLKMDLVPTITLQGLTEAQKKAYVIADNKLALNSSWDSEMLANELKAISETDISFLITGFDDIPEIEPDVDYGLLDEDIDTLEDGCKKAIQIEFELEHYDEAYELVKFWREQGAYVGYMLMNYLKAEKNKL
jgi:hypothetical protein